MESDDLFHRLLDLHSEHLLASLREDYFRSSVNFANNASGNTSSAFSLIPTHLHYTMKLMATERILRHMFERLALPPMQITKEEKVRIVERVTKMVQRDIDFLKKRIADEESHLETLIKDIFDGCEKEVVKKANACMAKEE